MCVRIVTRHPPSCLFGAAVVLCPPPETRCFVQNFVSSLNQLRIISVAKKREQEIAHVDHGAAGKIEGQERIRAEKGKGHPGVF